MSSSTSYHIVFRPPIDLLPSKEEMISFLKNYTKVIGYVCALEKGKSEGSEEFNHYDIVLKLSYTTTKPREDNIKRKFITKFEIPKDKRRNIKVYEIDEGRLRFQIGYCIKEGISWDDYNIGEDLEECGKEYQSKKDTIKVQQEKFKENKMNINEIATAFSEYVYLQGHNCPTGGIKGIAERDYAFWLQENINMIQFDVFQKINKEKLYDYACAYANNKLLKKEKELSKEFEDIKRKSPHQK